jgi:hypothetical protein
VQRGTRAARPRVLGHRRGIQSVYQRGHDLGPIDLVIVDEAHLIPPDGEGMYRRLLAGLGQVTPRRRVVGLTATPYRMKTGAICGPAPTTSSPTSQAARGQGSVDLSLQTGPP